MNMKTNTNNFDHECFDEILEDAFSSENHASKFKIGLGSRLRKARKAAKKTLIESGAASGVSCTTISRWEDGTYCPDMAQLYVLAKFYRIQFFELALGAKLDLLDISQLWPDTQKIVRRHIEYLLVSQQMVEDNWPETVRRIKRGNWNTDPPWKL